MSAEFPIVAITGSSGAGATTMIKALEHIFWRERIKAVYAQGNAFHRYDRKTMREEVAKARGQGKILSHFSPEGNCLDKLETLFFQYSATGTGTSRYYLHTRELAEKWGQEPGTFTPWQDLDKDSDLLVYRGLHGAAIVDDINIHQYPDLHIGLAPNANLEWIRKIHRDCQVRGYSREEVTQSILDRLHDYVYYITPQFSRTHINFQMIPVVDTSNPFGAEYEPTSEECYLVIRFQPQVMPDFTHLLEVIPGSRMSRRNTILVPGGKMLMAVEVILMPLIHGLITKSREIRNITDVPKNRGAGLLGIPG